MKKIALHVSLLTAVFTLNCSAEAAKELKAIETRIALVDPQSIIGSSDEWRDLAEEVQAEFQTKVQNLQKQKEEFNKKRSKADRGDMKELAKEQNNIEIEERALQAEFQQKQQSLQMQMMGKVDLAIEEVAKAQGWDAVLPKFFYVSSRADITLDVIAEMNKAYKKQKAASKFKKTEKNGSNKELESKPN